ncbi:hypothetical protein NC653_004895 [Populus alba x Populus x berolinensis]|uniref:Uncharacterized protein n=1 Tax=Populus alba x Populus x berolinensis TaxID=444605 RepID=A0AAD6WAF8_9ROSI|nr:hypothetical protein NC653_004895 [Populus alba x Populus x berolinensis]
MGLEKTRGRITGAKLKCSFSARPLTNQIIIIQNPAQLSSLPLKRPLLFMRAPIPSHRSIANCCSLPPSAVHLIPHSLSTREGIHYLQKTKNCPNNPSRIARKIRPKSRYRCFSHCLFASVSKLKEVVKASTNASWSSFWDTIHRFFKDRRLLLRRITGSDLVWQHGKCVARKKVESIASVSLEVGDHSISFPCGLELSLRSLGVL